MSCVGASHVVREGQLLSISPGLFLSSTLGYGSVKKVSEAHCKATFNLCLCKVSLLYLHVNACYRPRGLPPNFHGRWSGTTFSKRQYCATYQYAYSKARSSHPFSLILLGNILSLKKVPGRILVFFFYREGEAGGLHALLCKNPKTTKLTRWSSLFFSKSEAHSQCSSISLFLIITKTSRTLHNTFTMPLKSDNFSDFIEKKKSLVQRHFPCKISIFDSIEDKEEHPMKFWLNRQEINQW